MKKLLFALLLVITITQGQAHIGSPGVLFEGMLGKYHLVANIDPPAVIPGTAKVSVFLRGAEGDIYLTAKPVYWTAGAQGTPRADVLLPSADDPGKYEGEIWYMNFGASSVELALQDANGTYELVIPVMAVSTAQNTMAPSLGLVLSVLGLLLVVLLVTIIASSISDGLLKPGEAAPAGAGTRKITGIVVGTVLIVGILYGGKSWWDSWAASYQSQLYKPFNATSAVVSKEDGDYVRFSIDSSRITLGYLTRKISYIIPDHGKLMHMFLVREGSLDAFAHLHPRRLDTLTFESKLPPLPAGRYHVFADVSRFSGFSETIVSTLDIPENSNMVQLASLQHSAFDRDDTYLVTNAIQGNKPTLLDQAILVCGTPGQKTELPGGYAAIWETNGKAFRSGQLYSLDFALQAPDGSPAILEPYLGMMGHAVIMHSDGSVYIHLHPSGNYSLASQQVMVQRFQSGKTGWGDAPVGMSFADSIDRVVAWLDQLPDTQRDSLLMAGMLHELPTIGDPQHPAHSMVRFPYAFPKPGDYRLWLQVKINGNIVNGAFDVSVGG